MCNAMTNLLQLVQYILTYLPFMMVLHAPGYFLARTHWFQTYLVWKQISSFLNALEDNIHACGAMSKLISDCDQSEFRNCAQSILQEIFIDDWKSEPHYQHHNFYERRHHTVKYLTNTIIDRTGDTAYMWLLSLIYVWFHLNHKHADGINGIPTTKAK